jgi:hypothetical protein
MKLAISILFLTVEIFLLGCGETDAEDEEVSENTKKRCSDDLDNDDDGKVDCDDADCEAFCEDTEDDWIPVEPDKRHMLLRDEGNSALHYVDLENPDNNWHVEVPAGRDMQLVGSGRVMIGTEQGYQEYRIEDGEMVEELSTFSGTIAAQRLRNGNTLLVGSNWQGERGIVLVEVDPDGEIVRTIANADYRYVRLARQTPDGTFLVTSDTQIIEMNDAGKVIWEATVANSSAPHAWMAVRLASGDTVASCGYAANLQVFDENGELLKKITGDADVNPFFYAGFQIMRGGNYIVSNWQDHGEGHGDSGRQVIEYDPEGELVWAWEQDPGYVSSLQAVIVLDGLDLDKLHVENESGVLAAVKEN